IAAARRAAQMANASAPGLVRSERSPQASAPSMVARWRKARVGTGSRKWLLVAGAIIVLLGSIYIAMNFFGSFGEPGDGSTSESTQSISRDAGVPAQPNPLGGLA